MTEDHYVRSDGKIIDLIPEAHCTWCSKPILRRYMSHGLCMDCNTNLPHIKVNAVGCYIEKTRNNQLSKDILDFKHNPSIAVLLGECMVYIIKNRYQYLAEMDMIVSVPRGSSKRPYDQTKLLAEYVASELRIPYRNVLYKKHEFTPQHETPFEEKEANVKGKFDCIESVNGKRILLIDDTRVSGSTMNECARTLEKYGAKEVRGLVIGRAVDETHLNYIASMDG